MKVVCRLGGVLLMLLLPAILLAQSGPAGLFDARVAVDGEGAEERREATRAGLEQVLMRLTGRSDVIEQPGAEEVLERAERYLQQYSYEQAREQRGETGRQLRLRFDGSALERALIERNIAVWSPEDRPRTLVWMAVDRGSGREVIGGDRGQTEQQALRSAAAAQGLPVLVPLMDLEDQQALGASDLWGGFRAPILGASERYRPGAVVAGRLAERGGRWQARWLLFWDGGSHEISAVGDSLDAVMAGGMEGVSDYLAQRLAGVPEAGAGSVVYIRFEGMSSLADYAWAQQFMGGVRGVVQIDPYRVTEGFTDFRVQTEADASRLLRALQDSRRLAEAEVGNGERAENEDGARRPDYFFRMQ